MSLTKIEKKIVGYSVKQPESKQPAEKPDYQREGGEEGRASHAPPIGRTAARP